jgi:hypothetical protein
MRCSRHASIYVGINLCHDQCRMYHQEVLRRSSRFVITLATGLESTHVNFKIDRKLDPTDSFLEPRC